MSAIAPSHQTIPASHPGWIPSRLYRMGVDEYETLVKSGALKSRLDDRTLATEVYGPATIPVYWIVNLADRQVEVYTDPGPAGYLSTEVFPEGQSVPVVIDGQALGLIAVSDILPSERTG
jgi:hypothetical protein